MFERILVPLDGSELAERALPHALNIAQALRSPVHLMQAVAVPTTMILDPSIPSDTWQELIDSSMQVAAEYLDRVKTRFIAAGVPVTAGVEFGEAAVQIVDYASGPINTLTVMATHGRGGIARWVLGSVVEKVVRGGTSPVFLAPAFRPQAVNIKKILVPLDGSPVAAAILPAITDLARALQAELTLFQVFDVEGEQNNESAAWKYLQKETEALAAQGLIVHTAIRHIDPAEAILDYACRHEVNLIAMATHGRSPITRWALGSVTDKVLHATQVPMLLLRARK